MATQSMGTMSSIASAVTSRKHNVSLPRGSLSRVGEIVARQTVEQTEAGQSTREIKKISRASGITAAHAENLAVQSATKLAVYHSVIKPEAILQQAGTLSGTLKLDDLMGKKSLSDISKIFSEIDKFAVNKNMGRLSGMSKKQLSNLLKQYSPNSDAYAIIDYAMVLKDHQSKLKAFNMAISRRTSARLQIMRKKVKDLDSVETALNAYDAVRSVRRTISTIKRINRQINDWKAYRSDIKAAKKVAEKTAEKTVKKNIKKTAKKATQKAAQNIAKKTATKLAAGKTTGAATTVAGTAGGTAAAIVLIIVLAAIFVAMIVMCVGNALANTIPDFLKKEDKHSTYYESTTSLYDLFGEKDRLFIDAINNLPANNPPLMTGYYNHNTGHKELLTNWTSTEIIWLDGDGQPLQKFSNAKGILAAATMFIDTDYDKLRRTYRDYAIELWYASHTYTTKQSEVYECAEGCYQQSYQCTDQDFYLHKNAMHIIDGDLVQYSESGCVKCKVAYCSGCQTVECQQEEECPKHLICPGHLPGSCTNYTSQRETWKFNCSGCQTSSDGQSYCPYDYIHTGKSVQVQKCNGHCPGHQMNTCLGHVDLKIEVTINHIDDENNSLFDVDEIGKTTGDRLCRPDTGFEIYSWYGWDDDRKEHAIELANDDWAYLYGIGTSDNEPFVYTPVSQEVLKYEDAIVKYAEMYGIPEYVELIKAIIMHESGGVGYDIMDSSRFMYNDLYAGDIIIDPEYSINCGVHWLADVLKKVSPDGSSDMERIKLALQTYNSFTLFSFGPTYDPFGYLTYVNEHYDGRYTLQNATEYCKKYSGDPEYVPKVLKYYSLSKGNQSIIEIALKQVGNVGGQPYWSWYGFASREPWCACFVSWCADQSGNIDNGAIPKFAYCPTGANWFKERNQWRNRNYEPVAGDIIFFDWEGDGVTDHVGLVSKTSGGIVYTVEGNSSDQCKQKQYPVGSSCIYGYGIPNYSN